MQELISVIIAAYNAEEYIGRAIESIQNQTYKNIEIVIVNDGSTDNTINICNQYISTGSRLIAFNKTENEGLAAARKTGVLHANGDYIGFVDADDTIEIDMFEILISNARQYSADISHCGYNMIMPNGNKKEFYGTGRLVKQDHERGLIDLLEANFIEPTTCTKLYRRSLFIDLSYVTEVSINEDLMLNYLLFSRSQLSVFHDVCKYNYFKHEGSMSKSVTIKHITDPTLVKEKIYNSCCELESSTVQHAAQNRLVSQYIMNCFAIKRNRERIHKELFYEYRNKIRGLYKTSTLSKNERIKARIILYAPWLCRATDKLYRRFF